MSARTGQLSSKSFRLFSVLSALGGLTALFFTFAVPSESKNAQLGIGSVHRCLCCRFYPAPDSGKTIRWNDFKKTEPLVLPRGQSLFCFSPLPCGAVFQPLGIQVFLAVRTEKSASPAALGGVRVSSFRGPDFFVLSGTISL